MSVDWFLEHYPDYPATPYQIDFCRFLESKGKRFLVEFGFENAEKITWDEFGVSLIC